MNEYDTALKDIFQRLSAGMLKQVTGFAVARWLNVELPEVRNLRVDLLGETAEGSLVHIELQSTNDAEMGLRMAEYSLAIFRKFGKMPSAVVLYVGDSALRMKSSYAGPHLSFECPIVDVRELDGREWLESAVMDENLLAILFRFGTEMATVRRILGGIRAASAEARPAALTELFVLARLRKMGDIIKREVGHMPVLMNIMDDEVFGPLIRQGLAEGERRGLAEGKRQGQLQVVLLLLGRRFAPLPERVRLRVESMSEPDLNRLAERLLDGVSLDDLLE